MGERQDRWGQNLREVRENSGLTQTALAEAVGATQAAVSQWELGQVDIGDSHKIAVARVLDANPDEMFTLQGWWD